MTRNLRSSMYRGARLLGDYEAVRRGPKAIVKRVGRKALGRTWGRLLTRLIP